MTDFARIQDMASTPLGRRQRQVVELYVAGFTYAEIAVELGIKPNTVRDYLDRAKERWTLAGRPTSNRRDIIARAREDGIA